MEKPRSSSGKSSKKRRRRQKRIRRILIVTAAVVLIGAAVAGGVLLLRSQIGQKTAEAQDPFTPEPMAAETPTPAPAEPDAQDETVVEVEPVQAPETAEPTPEPTPEPEPEETPEPVSVTEPTVQTDYLSGRTFRKGDSDPVILQTQAKLMDLGYLDPDEPTETFENQVYDALVSFQRHNGLTPDGVLNEQTYALLVDGGAKTFVMQEGDTGDDVKEVQDRLYELGYLDAASRNGTFGEKTAAAVRTFQSMNRLKVDGKVEAKTLNTLYSGSVIGNYFKSGDADSSIIPYQQQLQILGYLDKNYECKGKMDDRTVSAVKLFQESNGLVRDGCLGPATTELMRSADAIAYAMRIGMSGISVRNAQDRLHKLGYIRSNQVTGYYGETTAEAVRAVQKRNSLTQDGEIDANTLERLNSDKAKEAAVSADKQTPTPKPGKNTPTPKPEREGKRRGVEKLIEIAESKLGCPYVRGAKGPDAFDCSGFVYWCLNQAGIKQGYMTSIIWRTCSKYKRINTMSELKRGDILVFQGETLDSGHVGFYLGDGHMIDASSSSGKVRITENDITKRRYWQEHFLMAYRIWD